MPPPFLSIPSKARNDPLGPGLLSALEGNLEYVRALASAEHLSTGEHNSMQVPRACVSIIWSGSAYSISPSSSDVTAVANPAVGTITLTLASSRFTVPIRPQINVKGSGVESKPWLSGYRVASATSVHVFLKKLSSALGGGNSWAATDASFDIALHSSPLASTAWSPAPALKLRGSYLTDQTADWNALVQAHGGLRAAQLAAHTSAGVHNVREVAKAYAHAEYDSGHTSYVLVGGAGSSVVSAITRSSAGIILVDYSSQTTPTQCFVCPDYQRYSAGDATALYTMHAAQTSATRSTLYIYQYDTGAKTWGRADADFFAAVHGG